MDNFKKEKSFYWQKFYKKNRHYHDDVKKLVLNVVPKGTSILVVGTKGGEILKEIPNKAKVGVELDESLYKYSRLKNKNLKIFSNLGSVQSKNKFDYVFLNHSLSETSDVQELISKINKLVHRDSKVLVTYFNYFWKPALDLIKLLNLRMPDLQEPNWLSNEDVDNFFYLENFEKVKDGKRFIFPFVFGKVGDFINRYIAQLPVINSFCLTNYAVYTRKLTRKELSISIVVPARNEAGNMKGVLSKIPKFAKTIEVIFVEGNSNDNTYDSILTEIRRYKGPINAYLYKQKGEGKGDAVRLGFSKAKNDLLMILDADLTVDPKELPKFYKAAIESKGDLIMGSRLIYPMEKLAMRTLNIVGNKFFSLAFSYLLGQSIKDTLCGTKVLLKSDYEKIAKNRKYFGDFDPFGDYDLIFGAAKLNMKIVEIPIRYKERTYGTTNISRFTHGWLLLKMCSFAAKRLKFI